MTLNAQEVRERMPLAEAVELEWRYVADEGFLEQLFETHRGRSYTRILSFPVMVQLVSDALLKHEGSARRELESVQQSEGLSVSIQAVYAKLRRIPIEVSMAFMNGCARRILELYPAEVSHPIPRSLRGFEVLILDGKTVKWVHKRLKVVRAASGGATGSKALVGLSLNRGLAVGMCGHPDGDAHEVRFVPGLLTELRNTITGLRLYLIDRAFCDRQQTDRFREEGDHFIVRYHPHVRFRPDPTCPPQAGHDAEGRSYVESWGWVGTRKDPEHAFVRQVVLHRTKEQPIVLFTDLLGADQYPATDILEAYRSRWGIERAFQEVTEVFGLQRLIGTSPQATLFQLAFCLLIYNIIQVVRAHIAKAQARPVQSISAEKLFCDVKKHLHGWMLFFTTEETVSYLTGFDTLAKVGHRLSKVLATPWTNVWLKSPPQRRNPPPRKPKKRTHVSIYRLIQADRARPRRPKEKGHA